jgi:hypothetical protein
MCWLDTPSGHLAIALFVFLVGIVLYVNRVEYGKEIAAGGLASLWTSLQQKKP